MFNSVSGLGFNKMSFGCTACGELDKRMEQHGLLEEERDRVIAALGDGSTIDHQDRALELLADSERTFFQAVNEMKKKID